MPSRLAARPNGSKISIQLPSQKTPSEISKINLRPSFLVRLFGTKNHFRAHTLKSMETRHFRRVSCAQKECGRMKISIPDFMAAAPRLWCPCTAGLCFSVLNSLSTRTRREFFSPRNAHTYSCIQVMRNGRRVEATAGQPAAAAFSRAKRTTRKL